ncbi:CDP-diacylglycerol diphosphatase [soil metagenome]
MTQQRRRIGAALVIALVALTNVGTAQADPNALWTIVHDQCVPDQQSHGDPAPCADVDVTDGPQTGYAVLKDIVGATQFLLIPTADVPGIESPELLAPGAVNYFDAAWRARTFVDERAGWTLPRDWMSLAINSAVSRTQNQLHIHIDCASREVRAALTEHGAEVGPNWAPFPVPLAGHPYQAMAVSGENLDAANPFVLLADGVPGARENMGDRTLVVVGANDPDGRPGFIVLTDVADPATGNTAAGEELQDHDACAQPPAA